MVTAMAKTISDWFKHPDPPITHVFNTAMPGHGVPMPDGEARGWFAQDMTPAPQRLYDLGSYSTPYNVVWRRPRNVLTTGGP